MQNNLKIVFFLAAQWLIYSEVMNKSAQTSFLVSRKSQHDAAVVHNSKTVHSELAN